MVERKKMSADDYNRCMHLLNRNKGACWWVITEMAPHYHTQDRIDREVTVLHL